MRDSQFLDLLGVNSGNAEAINEVTYFTCLKILSETLGKLSIKMYQDTEKGVIKAKTNDVYNLLKLRPNPYMTASVFWATIERNRNHFGNAYVWCRYQRGKLIDLWIMQNEQVEVYIDDAGYFGKPNKIWYIYTDPKTNKTYTMNSDTVLHFKTSNSDDGILGKSVRDTLTDSIEGASKSQRFMNKLYKEGMTARAVLQYTGDLDKEAKRRLLKGVEEFATGENNAGKIIPIPLGMQIQPLDIKLADAQFFDLKKYNALQIAGAFGIKPNHLNDYSKSSYSNSEMQQLSFYVDTLQFILKQYEEEITYKLLDSNLINQGYFFKFNEGSILRADMKTQAECLAKYVNNGIYTPNEARELLNLPTETGGDKLIVNGNYIPIDLVGTQYVKGGELNEE
jgi:HK97 family phage portal protein